MRKFLHWMLAAILICGSSVFTSCNNSDNPVDNPSTKKVDLAITLRLRRWIWPR